VKFYDIEVTAEQLRAAAEWAEVGGTPVQLCVDDSMLIAGQGDEKMAWDTGGEKGSDEYVALAPLDPSPTATRAGEPLGERIARMGRELIDPDYDPAAEDEDGVPIFSEETRAEAAGARPTDDPRYQRGAH
jgi:hypothetical protein